MEITDETVIEFYKKNPNIDINTINRVFIDILTNLSSNMSSILSTNINSQILSIVTDIQTNLQSVKNDILIKFYESKKEYIDSVKLILDNSSLNNNDKVAAILEKHHDTLIHKTTTILNEIIPKTNDKQYTQIEKCIHAFCNTITQDTAKLLQQSSTDSNIMSAIDIQFGRMITTIQQPIFNYIQSSEERMLTNVTQVKDTMISQQSQQTLLTNELNEFLNKYKHNSSTKGNVSEVELYYMLQSILPADDIVNVSSTTASCDYRVNRRDMDKPSILFENKDYTRSVTTEEVKKFERDLQVQKLHGIFISQNSPITYKNNFQIDIIDNLIHIYIPNADYSAQKLKMAIDIIDSLSIKLQQISQQNVVDDISISKDDLDDIVAEYHLFVSNKLQMMDTIKLVSKQLMDKLDDIQLPKLKKIFVKFGAIEGEEEFKCSVCNLWTGPNKASLSAHMRHCNKTTVAGTISTTNGVNIGTIDINMDVKKSGKKSVKSSIKDK